jgi:hypothetical protein
MQQKELLNRRAVLFQMPEYTLSIIGEYNFMLYYTNITVDISHCMWYSSDT